MSFAPFMSLALFVALSGLAPIPPPLSPEVKLVIASLRSGERERIEKALGPIGDLPLYRAELDFNPNTRIVTGKVLVTVTPKQATSSLSLRVTANANNEGAVKLTTATVNGVPATALALTEGSLYKIRFAAPAPAGVPFTVEARLTARVPAAEADSDHLAVDPDAMDGPGGDYGAFSVTPEVTCLAGLIPMVPFIRPDGAPAAAPSGIGDLGTFDPSHFLITLSVPSGYSVVAPGEKIGEVPDAQGRVRTTYAVAAARELPMLVTKGYQVSTVDVGDITVESHFSAQDAKTGKTVLTHAANALRTIQEKLGPYPYRKFRVVEAHLSNGAGGMEFPGLITVATSIYRGSTNPLGALGMPELTKNPILAPLLAAHMGSMIANTLEFTVDHEVAHQYIAMLVGNDPIHGFEKRFARAGERHDDALLQNSPDLNEPNDTMCRSSWCSHWPGRS